MSGPLGNRYERPATFIFARQFAGETPENRLAALGALAGLIHDHEPFENIARAIRARNFAMGWRPRHSTIIQEVATSHRISVEELKGRRRQPMYVLARQEAMFRLRRELNLSYPRIGQLLGGRDHSTIIHGVSAHAKRTREVAA